MPPVVTTGTTALGSVFLMLQGSPRPTVPAVNVPATVELAKGTIVEPLEELRELTTPPVPPLSARFTARFAELNGAVLVSVAPTAVVAPVKMLITAGLGKVKL